MISKRLGLKLFIEGIEVPVIGATVQITRSSPAVASIQVVSLDEIHRFKKQTMVHLFYYDVTAKTYDFTNPENYKLLFTGELIGIEFNANPSARMTVLKCADFTINWDKAYQYMITYGPNGNVLTPEGANYGAGDTKFNNIIDGHAAVMLRYLNKTPTTPGLQGLKGLVGGIVSFIEAFGGVDKHTNGVNDYFAISELKNHVLQQIVAEDNDDTARNLFDAKEFMEWLERGVTTLGELCRLSDMINMLFKYIYYEYVTNVTPLYTPGTTRSPDAITLNTKINNGIDEAILDLKDDKIIENIKLRAQHAMGVIRVLIDMSTNEKQKNIMISVLDNLNKLSTSDEYTKAVITLITSTKKLLSGAKTKNEIKKSTLKADRLGSFIFKPECPFVAVPRCNVIFPEHKTQWSYSSNFLNEYTRLRLQSGMAFIGNDKLLADYSYAPSRKEIAALAKEQGTYGVRALLPWEKFSGIQPKFEYLNEINYVANKRQKELQKGTVRLIENKNKGKNLSADNVTKIAVSLKQKAANFNFFKARFGGRSMNISMRFNPFLVAGFPALVLSRPFFINEEDIKGIAKKQGFALDKVSDQDIVSNIDDYSTLLEAPMHYVGYIDTLVHAVDQSGGTTTCNLSYVRTHKLDNDDFLSLQQAKVTKELNIEMVQTQYDITEAINRGDQSMIKLIQDLTYQNVEPAPTSKGQSVIIGLADLDLATEQVDLKPKLNISAVDVVSTNLRVNSTNKDVKSVGYIKTRQVDGGTIQIPTQYGKLAPGKKGPKGTIKEVQIVDDTILSVNGKNCWKTVILYEEKKTNQKIRPIPIEEIIRPNWFSPLYSNLYIGENIYKKFLGTGSIVDQLVFQSQSGLSLQGLADKKQALEALSNFTIDTTDTLRTPDAKLYDIPSVATAADILAFQYGRAIQTNADIERFVDDYTGRPVASMIDIFGTPDLEYRRVGDRLEIVSGKPGFHSTAVAKFGDLVGIIDNPDLALPSRFGDGKTSTISRTNDPRPDRQRIVEEYAEKLRSTEPVVSLEG